MSCLAESDCFTATWDIENSAIFLRCREGESKLTSPSWTTETTSDRAASWHFLAYHTGPNILFKLINVNDTWFPNRWELSVNSPKGKLKTGSIYFQSVIFNVKKRDLFGVKTNSSTSLTTLSLELKMWYHELKRGEVHIHSAVTTINWGVKDHSFFNSISTPYSSSDIIEKDDMRINMTLDRKIKYHGACVNDVALFLIDGSFSFVDCRLLVDGETTESKYSGNYNSLRSEWRGSIEIAYRDGNLKLRLESTVAHHSFCPTQHRIARASSVEADTAPGTVVGPVGSDLLRLYKESLLTDATINTKGKSFAVQRSVLALGSPVFRAMFENPDTAEARQGVVDVDDVKSETMDRTLVVLYGGSVKVASQEEASALYYAADKYDVPSLKYQCVEILKSGLTADNVCDTLVLADRHSDQDLMTTVVDFLLDNHSVVSSAKWAEFEDVNPRLAAKVSKGLFLKKASN